MKKLYAVLLCFICAASLQAQSNYYFPPAGNNQWDTLSPTQDLGWCQYKIDTLVNYLNLKHTKGFIILKDGKIALEKYFGTFTKDSLWYWASAGKSLTAFLAGIAQQEGDINIDSATATYLGQGWTVEPPEKEALIKVWHQLTMTTGIAYANNDMCTADTCLEYEADAGTEWFYNTAPYRLINNVIENATGINYNSYTNTKVKQPTGMSSGIWIQDVYYSRARDAARFGLLMLNKGKWNGNSILQDTAYYNDMINTSQNLNLSYGYLWWLNGKASNMLPATSLVFPGEIIPAAPADLYAALGKNDQKIYVVPSKDMVVVRFGNSADISLFAVSNFDNELWIRIMDLECVTGVEETMTTKLTVYPNPASNHITINLSKPADTPIPCAIYNNMGQFVYNTTIAKGVQNQAIQLPNLPSGMYYYIVGDSKGKLLIN